MKKITYLLLAFAALAFVSCEQTESAKNMFQASGVSHDAKYAYFAPYLRALSNQLDSVEVVDGKFVVEDSIIGGVGGVEVVVAGRTGWMFVTNDGNVNLLEGGRVGGTPLNDELQAFADEVEKSKSDSVAVANLCNNFFNKHNDGAIAVAGYVIVMNYKHDADAQSLLQRCSPDVQNYIKQSVQAMWNMVISHQSN